MAASLQQHDPGSQLWVLSLDAFTTRFLRELKQKDLHVTDLSELEKADAELLKTKANRTRVEYYFTLSPCWPLHLLRENASIQRITYVDADMFFFASPEPIFAEMKEASVLVTEHRYPPHLSHHERYGRFNVGLLSFCNDSDGLMCLDDWREKCIDWCYDRDEDGKYADQKYLDAWPELLGKALHIVRRRGVNLAPWNWSQYHYTFPNGRCLVNCDPLELFHFARFRPNFGCLFFQSGQLEYGIMPWRLRQHVYGTYWRALKKAETRVSALRSGHRLPCSTNRGWHGFWRAFIPRVIFGSDWLRVGSYFISGRFGLGRYSGQILSWLRRRFGKQPAPVTRKPHPVLSAVPFE